MIVENDNQEGFSLGKNKKRVEGKAGLVYKYLKSTLLLNVSLSSSDDSSAFWPFLGYYSDSSKKVRSGGWKVDNLFNAPLFLLSRLCLEAYGWETPGRYWLFFHRLFLSFCLYPFCNISLFGTSEILEKIGRGCGSISLTIFEEKK